MNVSKNPVKLVDAPVGIFRSVSGAYGFKTEYSLPDGGVDAYCIESGESWWGPPPQTLQSQRDGLVYPVDFRSILEDAVKAEDLSAKCERLEKDLLIERDLHRKTRDALDASIAHSLANETDREKKALDRANAAEGLLSHLYGRVAAIKESIDAHIHGAR